MAKARTKKLTDAEQVKVWLENLASEFKPAVESVRSIIKKSEPRLNERIKWNAPSYYYKEDIVTIGPLRSPDKIILVFHHPSIIKIKSDLLQGDYKDRRLVYLNSIKEIKAAKEELERIIRQSVQIIGE